tara:strand:+ start:44 stop:175 length:132 start_codon:yes stop_codon:yes gene_type:complete
MVIIYNKDLLIDPLVTNGKEECPGCVYPRDYAECEECSTFKDH